MTGSNLSGELGMNSSHAALAPYWTPHAGQEEFLNANARIRVLACGRRWGKTDACAASIVAAILDSERSRHLIIAPTLDQARLLFERVLQMIESVSNRLVSVWPAKGLKPRRTPYPSLKIGGHTVEARSGHMSRSLRGNEATNIVIDEAAFVPEELVSSVAMPMLATTDGTLTLISTPRGQNHFWRFYEMGRNALHGVWSRRAPSRESPYVSPGFLQVQRELISERAFAVEYEAEFLDSEGRVFRTEAIDQCLVPELSELDGPVHIGIDWARYTDYTAVAVVRGTRSVAQLVECTRMQGIGWHQQLRAVGKHLERHPGAVVNCDATGIGDPLLEMLQEANPERAISGTVFTNQSKSALIDNLAWMLENGSIEMQPNPALIRELQHFEARTSDFGRTRLGAPSGFSDDMVIALALACASLPYSAPAGAIAGRARRFEMSAKETEVTGETE